MIIREIRALANMDGFGLPCPISGVLFGGEDQAHKFIISREDGQAITGTVAVKFLRYADDVTVPLTGSIEDGAATVTLNESCYLRPGRFKLTMYVTESESTTAVYCCMGTVDRTDGQRTVDPGSEITLDVTDLINQIDEAVDSIPPTWTELSDEVDELKSALGKDEITSLLLADPIPDTVQAITFDGSGNVQTIAHSRDGATVRTDAFVFADGSITETRTLATGESLTIITNTDTLVTTTTYAEETA